MISPFTNPDGRQGSLSMMSLGGISSQPTPAFPPPPLSSRDRSGSRNRPDGQRSLFNLSALTSRNKPADRSSTPNAMDALRQSTNEALAGSWGVPAATTAQLLAQRYRNFTRLGIIAHLMIDGMLVLLPIDLPCGYHRKSCVKLLRHVAQHRREQLAIKATLLHNGNLECLFHLHLQVLHQVIHARQVSRGKRRDHQVALYLAIMLAPRFPSCLHPREDRHLSEVQN